MKHTNRSALPCKVLVLCLFALSTTAFAQETHSQPTKKLTIDRLYSLPWLIGTKPEDPKWSPDSQHLAFLWNDDGTNFYDVWLADRTTGKPIRITSMPRPFNPPDPGTDIAKLEQQARAETDHGVSDVIWAPDGKHLLFNFHGHLYLVLPGQTPHQLIDSDSTQTSVASSPSGNRVAYLSGGNLWVMTLEGNKPAAKQIYAPGKNEVTVEEFHWSTDGKQLAFIEADASRVPTRGIPNYLGDETTMSRVKRPFPGEPSESRRLGFISADGGSVQWADLGGDPLDLFFGVSWSPDSKTVLVDKSDLYIKDRRLFLVDPVTGQAKLLLRETDPKNVTAEWWSDWAPDGRGIYFISDRDNDYHLYYEPVAGGEPKPITSGKLRRVLSLRITRRTRCLCSHQSGKGRRAPSLPRAARGRHAATNHRNPRHAFARTVTRRTILRRRLLQRHYAARSLSDQRLRISGRRSLHATDHALAPAGVQRLSLGRRKIC